MLSDFETLKGEGLPARKRPKCSWIIKGNPEGSTGSNLNSYPLQPKKNKQLTYLNIIKVLKLHIHREGRLSIFKL